ncbi:uncharacterized protein LOC141608505 [Silene latifolia]|uniref:uncharacterized protein LOC141608505 n=1 Tax=Silene latifolia TaxID=37657 RepID=UPI003D78225D
METLVVVAHHRNQYYGGGTGRKGNSPPRFGSLPSRGFSDINCRSFETGMGLLPSPFKDYESPVSNRGLLSPKPQSPSVSVSGNLLFGGESKSEDVKKSKRYVKSSPIAINLKGGSGSNKQGQLRENLSFSELWAGPAYSNSPPPSSLPMPKFDMKPKRTVSLELPAFESDVDLPPMAKSAPTSPTSSAYDYTSLLSVCNIPELLRLLFPFMWPLVINDDCYSAEFGLVTDLYVQLFVEPFFALCLV